MPKKAKPKAKRTAARKPAKKKTAAKPAKPAKRVYGQARTIQHQFRVSEEEHKKLKRLADERGISTSQFIRQHLPL